MKNWKRGAALLAALGLSLNLLGCGSSTPSGVQQSSPEQGTPPPVAEEVEPEEVVEPEYEELEPEPEPGPAPEPAKTTGLVIADVYATKILPGGRADVPVYCINPGTGEETLISNFNIENTLGVYDDYSLWTAGPYGGGPYYRQYTLGETYVLFSSDYTKLAAQKVFTARGDIHAGWFDTEGNFFDVIEVLGWGMKNDFDEPINYRPIGFSGNYFGFSKDANSGTEYYYVPIDNVTPSAVQEGYVLCRDHPYEVSEEGGIPYIKTNNRSYAPTDITSWIDSTHCIINSPHPNPRYTACAISLILDTETKEEISYIPGDSRNNWNGMVSPDGKRIAFMSETRKSSTPSIELYTVPVEGGDPVKVTGYSLNLGSRLNSFNTDRDSYVLIGWI